MEEVLAAGRMKLASMPAGGGCAPATSSGGASAAAAAPAEEKKKEESESSPDFSVFKRMNATVDSLYKHIRINIP